jgi:hypothetical protein
MRGVRGVLAGLVVCGVLVGCSTTPPRAALPASEVQDGMHTVAFAHLIRSGGGASAFYLALKSGDGDVDPSPELIGRFAGARPPVLGVSECKVTESDIIDRETGSGGGVLLRLAEPRWLDGRTVELYAEYRFGGENAATYRLRLARSQAGWQLLEEQPLWLAGFAVQEADSGT